jgi:hypothetical protein
MCETCEGLVSICYIISSGVIYSRKKGVEESKNKNKTQTDRHTVNKALPYRLSNKTERIHDAAITASDLLLRSRTDIFLPLVVLMDATTTAGGGTAVPITTASSLLQP